MFFNGFIFRIILVLFRFRLQYQLLFSNRFLGDNTFDNRSFGTPKGSFGTTGCDRKIKIIINLINGKPLSVIFKTPVEVSFTEDKYLVKISKAAVFTNFMGIKRKLESIPPAFLVEIDLEDTLLVDHSVMENLNHFKHDYEANGGEVNIIGLENHQMVSDHPLAARKKRVLEGV